jgi:hypothetical protein
VCGRFLSPDHVDYQRVPPTLRRNTADHPSHHHQPAGLVTLARDTNTDPDNPTTDDVNISDPDLRLQYWREFVGKPQSWCAAISATATAGCLYTRAVVRILQWSVVGAAPFTLQRGTCAYGAEHRGHARFG